MRQLGLPTDYRLHNHVFDLVHELRCVAALLLQNLQDRTQRPFVALIAIPVVWSVLVVLRKLVDRVVRQMHVDVVHVSSVRLLVGLCAKSGKGHLVQVDSERRNTIQKHVETQVVLEAIDQVWLVDVLLHNVAAALVHLPVIDAVLLTEAAVKYIVRRTAQKDTFPLTQTVWFYNVSGLIFVEFILRIVTAQIQRLTGQHPGLRVKLELFGKELLHPAQIPCQVIFARDAQDPRVHVDFLPRVQLGQKVRADRQVVPSEVEQNRKSLIGLSISDGSFMVFFEVHESPVQVPPCHFLNHIVLRLAHIDHQPVFWIFVRE